MGDFGFRFGRGCGLGVRDEFRVLIGIFVDVLDFVHIGLGDTDEGGEFDDDIDEAEAGGFTVTLEVGRQFGEIRRDAIEDGEHAGTQVFEGFMGGVKCWQIYRRRRGLGVPPLSLLIPFFHAPCVEGAARDAEFEGCGGDILPETVEGFEGGGFFIGRVDATGHEFSPDGDLMGQGEQGITKMKHLFVC